MSELAKRVLDRLRREQGKEAVEPRRLTPEEVATLPLEDFATRRLLVKVWSEVLDGPIWFVSGEPEVEALLKQGVARGDIFTVGELLDLIEVFREDAEKAWTVIEAKRLFDGVSRLER